MTDLTQSLLDAYQVDENGEIYLSLKQKGEDLHLQVSDNSVGMKLVGGQPEVSMASFGLELVASLAQKLKGKLTIC